VLLREWPACKFEAVCPHGRPIVKHVPLTDLLREFGRIWPRAPFDRERVRLDLK
jgi:hypothetical protein